MVKFNFRHLDLRVCQISSPIEKLEIFPLWWKIFHFQKSAKKKFFFAELHELEHSAEGTFFRKIGNFSTFPIFSKIPKIYLFGPTSVLSFSKIEETFFLHSSSFIIHHHHHHSSSSSFIIIIIICYGSWGSSRLH